jgi:hypothetical protein
MDERMVESETRLIEMLNDLPLAPLPPHFVSEVMAQLKPAAKPAPIPIHFRLEFLDWAIPAFTAVFALAIFFLWSGLALPNVSSLPAALSQFFATFNSNWLALILLTLILEIYVGIMLAYWLWSDNANFVIRNP